jgi:hypothetical protein
MKYLKTFENLEKDRFSSRPRVDKDNKKRCLGQCDRKVVIKDDKPAIYCAGCDRYLKSL